MPRDQPLLQVRPVAPSEWSALREIRLRALADAPEAFGSTLQRERELPDAAWRERATATADKQMWSARGGGEWIGLVGAVRGSDSQVELVSMWVDPAWRRRGVARALIAGVVGWYREGGSSELLLWVSADNPGAWLCYETEGFQLTGSRHPLPSDPSRERLEMRFVGSEPR